MTVDAEPEQVLTLPMALRAPADVKGSNPEKFTVRSRDGVASEQVDSTFFGPM